jgi:GxxExxY protein
VVRRQLSLPVRYRGIQLEAGYRLDLVVDECVLVELKTVEQLSDLHMSQILTYLKLSGMSLGYLLNFNVRHMKQGIKRVVYRLN